MNVCCNFVSTFNALNNRVSCIIKSIINLLININVRNSIKFVENVKKVLFEINEFSFEINEILFKIKKLLFEIEKMLFETKKVKMLQKINVNNVEILLFNSVNVSIIIY